MLSGSELWLLRLMADRGLALLDASGLLVVVEESSELRVAAVGGDEQPSLRILPVERSALGALYRAGGTADLDQPRGPEAAWLHELGVNAQAALVEPLIMDERPGGLVIALRRDTGFRDPDRQALKAFAESVSRRLAAERSVEIERLRHGLEARERERKRWAREIHDETIQGLGALRLKLANARDLDDPAQLRDAVESVLEGLGVEIDGLRHLITELRPAALDDLGLVPALEALARRAQAVDNVTVHTQIELASYHDEQRLDPELESTIYRVVQEALTNVGRHSGASQALVRVIETEGALRAIVSDDGSGLGGAGERTRDAGASDSGGGFGMAGMRERAELVGGELELRTSPSGGVTVQLTVPLRQRAGARVSPSDRHGVRTL
jgi:signal transduction histidine kinase